MVRELAAQFLALAEKQGTTVPLMIGHRLMGISLLSTGRHRQGRAHFDRAISALRSRRASSAGDAIWPDIGVAILSYRSLALWLLGYPEAALADADRALKDAREIGQAATLMFALVHACLPISSAEITRQQTRSLDELVALADEKGALFWKAFGECCKVALFALTGEASDAVADDHLRDRPHSDQREQHVVLPLSLSHIWREPTRNSVNSMTHGAASTKR